MKGINSFSILMVCVVLASCKADMICPAYQSYFLLDETTQKNQFGYFALDSLPRRDVFYSSLDKNGLVAKTSLFAYIDKDWVRERELRTVNMEVIYPEISDSLLFSGDVMMYAETDIVDSTALDSARMAAQTFRYGADQKYYNWYFRDKLVWKDELEGTKEETDNVLKEEEGGFFSFLGFFKNLFKKKEKVSADGSETIDAASQQDEDGLEENPAEKKGIFKKKDKQPKQPKEKKVKSKKEKKPDPAPSKPSSPSEPEDDGEDDFRL